MLCALARHLPFSSSARGWASSNGGRASSHADSTSDCMRIQMCRTRMCERQSAWLEAGDARAAISILVCLI